MVIARTVAKKEETVLGTETIDSSVSAMMITGSTLVVVETLSVVEIERIRTRAVVAGTKPTRDTTTVTTSETTTVATTVATTVTTTVTTTEAATEATGEEGGTTEIMIKGTPALSLMTPRPGHYRNRKKLCY